MALEGLRSQLDAMVPLVRQVMRQTRARIFDGNTRFAGKLVSCGTRSLGQCPTTTRIAAA
jgi:hypothetical protein